MLKNNKEKILEKEISEEMKLAYIDYAMSVIISRAIPDVRDGLKPVQRRILFAMYEDGLKAEGKFKKAATVVGSTLGRYHPHGDQPVYDAAIRMAQDFTLRYPLIEGQGNIGSIDDPNEYAAMRYVEMKLSKIGEEMLKDIEKETVDFVPNYDGTRKEPVVLPSPLPNILLNGALGIAVGMATNIPPHNLNEVCDALCFFLDNPKATIQEICQILPGPDFPTGGIIFDQEEIIKAYAQGKGKIIVRAKAQIIEGEKQRKKIIITEIPYQVQKSTLLENLAKLVEEKKIEGIRDIRDESDREGLRIVIELEKEAIPKIVLEKLFRLSDLQKTYHLNMVAISNGVQPKLFSLLDILEAFIEHRKEIVKRRTKYELKKAKEREHLLVGIEKCLSKIDFVISLIKNSKDKEEAREKLKKALKIDDLQANAILEMKLASLARLERKKIEEELKSTKEKIKECEKILKSEKLVKEIIKKELKELKEKFGDKRKTQIVKEKIKEIKEEELIPEETVLVTLTREGYIKRVSLNEYKVQKRGGRGVLGIKTKDEDLVEKFLLSNTKDNLLIFSNFGRVFSLPVFDLPKEKREGRGKLITSFLKLKEGEKIVSILSFSKENLNENLIFVTLLGKVKKTKISFFEKVKNSGILAISLKDDDNLVDVKIAKKGEEVLIFTKKGKAIRFKEDNIREMGRTAEGVLGIKLEKGDSVSGIEIINPELAKKGATLLTVSEFGFGKRTNLKEYKLQKRAGMGIKAMKINQKTGNLIFSKLIGNEEDLILVSEKGKILRTKISGIPKLSRATQGVRLMKLEQDKIVAGICG